MRGVVREARRSLEMNLVESLLVAGRAGRCFMEEVSLSGVLSNVDLHFTEEMSHQNS